MIKPLTANEICDIYYCNPRRGKLRTVLKVARELLLKDTILSRGEMFAFHAKPIGAGVWEVWLEEKIYT